MKTIAIVGASGFIGRHLLAELVSVGGYRVKILSRSGYLGKIPMDVIDQVEVVVGDLRNPITLEDFIEPSSTVVNLCYLWRAGEAENLTVIRNLLDACKAGAVGRLIHCSTAAVVGRASEDCITEGTPCRPMGEYGITKLKIEQTIIESSRYCFDSVILRPTSVFGPKGDPLKKLAQDLVSGLQVINYLKSSIFGRRRMNLVHIANVVAAILFMANRSQALGGEVFIVSNDDALSNNFSEVERSMRQAFGLGNYILPKMPVPSAVLKGLLAGLGRNNINPRCSFSADKLKNIGFEMPVEFELGLSEYVQWYAKEVLGRKHGVV